MAQLRKTAIFVGLFYIAATAAGILSVVLMPDLVAPDSLAILPANRSSMTSAALLEFTMAVLIAGIAIMLYPVLVRQNETLALGYLVARLVESIIFMVAVISLLTLLTLSQEMQAAGASNVTYLQIVGALLLAVREWGGAVLATIAFGLSALLLNTILFRSELVPQWLSGWGLFGAILYTASGLLPLVGYGSSSAIYGVVQAILGLQEMILALWLIAKGFNAAAMPTRHDSSSW